MIKLNVYDDNGAVLKTVSAEKVKLKFGAIRSIMELLNVENIEDTASLLKTVYSAWGQLTRILSKCFPDMTEADWENVELSELVPAVIEILRYSFSEILTIPKDEKN